MTTPANASAQWMFERIVRTLQGFEAGLASDEEIGLRLAAFGDEVLFISDIGFWEPDLVKFVGVTGAGERFEIIQHVAQVGLMVVARRKVSGTPRRIGFILDDMLKKPGEPV